MQKIRRSEDRGKANHGWLKAYHTFSFGDYYDRDHMGFRSLRVINEDRVEPKMGFGTHPHSNMEIITYIISGALAHKDSMGNGRTIYAGEVQAMSAGSGITHSEFNPSSTEVVHLLQIWIIPNTKNLTPSYSEWKPPADTDSHKFTLLASPNSDQGSVKIHQDVSIYLGNLKQNETLQHQIQTNRHLWLQMIDGELSIDDLTLSNGDAVAISDEQALKAQAKKKSKFLLFDMS